MTEDEARDLASKKFSRERVTIIHSPHADNKKGDYYVVAPDEMVRSWESVLFTGKGIRAIKGGAK